MISIDPAPAKRSTVFDGERYSHLSAVKLREHLRRTALAEHGVLICWDAPLTGPADVSSPGAKRGDFTKRSIERFFSTSDTRFNTPSGISVLGYGACPHWTISRSLLGLPRVGEYDVPESKLPFRLVTQPDCIAKPGRFVVEVHPALAAWLWCRDERGHEASWVYKGSKVPTRERQSVWRAMWDLILSKTACPADLPCPESDDEFDAAVGYVLGMMLALGRLDRPGGCTILGDAEHGAFLVPYDQDLESEWKRWLAT